MRFYWIATAFKLFPVKIQSDDRRVIGTYNSITSLELRNSFYNFTPTSKPISELFSSPNEYVISNDCNERLSVIRDPQWLKEIEIKLQGGNSYTLQPRKMFGENYSIKFQNTSIGQFHEQFFALTPRGYLELQDAYSQNTTLLASILYICLYKKMVSV